MLIDNYRNICTHINKQSKDYTPISPEITQTSTFYFDDYATFIEESKDEKNNFVYTRGSNPTTENLEQMIAQLVGGEKCKVFSSGMGAITATLLTLLQNGDHMIMLNTIYGEAYSFAKYIEKFGIELTKVYIEKPEDVSQYIKSNTKLIYIESPSHQKCQLIDLEQITNIATQNNIYTLIDATWSSPLFLKPLDYGIDIVIHSISKYIGGHSDIVGGAVISTEKIVDDISEHGHQFLGAVSSPFNSWLAIRGLRTLPVRMTYLSSAVTVFIEAIKDDQRIKKIYHPYTASGYQKKLSEKYLTGYGSLLSLELVDEDFDKLINFVDELKYFSIGVSWGGFESLVLPSYKGGNFDKLKERGLKKSHIRLYIGLEDTQTLIDDFKNSLDKVYG